MHSSYFKIALSLSVIYFIYIKIYMRSIILRSSVEITLTDQVPVVNNERKKNRL